MSSTSIEARAPTRIGDKVRIVPRGKRGIYTANFWHNGLHHKRSLKTANFAIARQRAIKIEADLACGAYATPPKPVTLADVVDEYMEVKRGEGRKAKTLVKYREWLDSFATFGGTHGVRTVQQVTPRLFELFRADRGKTRSAKTMSNGLVIIKQLLKWCSGGGREYLIKNPIAQCKVPRVTSRPAFTPTLEQVNALLAAAVGDRQIEYALLAFTGLRVGEMAMLRPCDVDLKAGWIKVASRPGWEPKSRVTRRIPIHPRLAALLRTIATSGQPYFFCAAPSPKYPRGGHHINVKHVNSDLQKLAKRLHMPIGRKNDGLVVHSLRHFFETQCVDSNVPQFVIDAWMGHTSASSMGRLYYGLTDAKSQQFIKQVQF